MAQWSRVNPWRQGRIIPHALACGMGLVADDDAGKRLAIIVTHDCDIAQEIEAEPEVEIIVGTIADKVNGNLTAAKNPRRLHLPVLVCGNVIYLDLLANGKVRRPKSELIDQVPRGDITLSATALTALQTWLASRYRRGAFPDAFDDRFKSKKTKVRDKIISILKGTDSYIEAVYFDIDEGKEVTRTDPTDTYTLDIYMVYSTEFDPETAQIAAEDVCRRVEGVCHAKWFTKEAGWCDIELRECIAVSDEAFTYRQSQLLKRWNIDYVSLTEVA